MIEKILKSNNQLEEWLYYFKIILENKELSIVNNYFYFNKNCPHKYCSIK